MNLVDFFNKTDKEIETLLKNNTHVSPNNLVYFANSTDHTLYKVLGRKKEYAVIDDLSVHYVSDLIPLTIDTYKQLKEQHIKKSLSPKTAESFVKILTSIISKYYNDDRFEISITDTYYIDLKIYYPQIEISNNNGDHHIMTDVYVMFKFYIEEGNLKFKKLYCTRGSFTMGEFKSDYVFSHLNSAPGYILYKFCYGNTSLANTVYQYKRKITVFDISHFIIAIEEYFKWESLEGTPYGYINRIKEYKIETVSPIIDTNIVDEYYNHVLSKLTNFNYNITSISDSKYVIKLTSETIDDIKQILTDRIVSLDKQDFYFGRSIEDKFGIIKEFSDEEIEKANKTVQDRAFEEFKFKGEYIIPTVSKKQESTEELERLFPMTIAPRLVHSVVNRFQKEYIIYLEKHNLKIL